MSIALLASAGKGAAPKLYPEDVFSTYLYTGNGATQTINNGIDLAGKGGLVWTKIRSAINSNGLISSATGLANYLMTDSTSVNTGTTAMSSFNSNGYSLNTGTGMFNYANSTYASWTFRKAPKFFDIVTYTGDGVAGRQIPHNLGCEVGMIVVKSIDVARNWLVQHRSISAANYLNLNTTAAQTANINYWNSTHASDSVFTLGLDVDSNKLGETYVAYLYAHDTSADGIIQCGSFTTNASGNFSVALGWEPQYILWKTSSTSVQGSWNIFDSARGMAVGGFEAQLAANYSSSETNTGNYLDINATGFSGTGVYGSNTLIYMAIRRPNKVPTSGTEVFAIDNGDGTSIPAFNSGFPVDMAIRKHTTTADATSFMSRLLQGTYLDATSTAAEASNTAAQFGYMNGFDSVARVSAYYAWMFKRAKGFFDIVAYTGTGVARTVNHNLGVAPELMIVKCRSVAGSWFAMFGFTGSDHSSAYLEATNAGTVLAYGSTNWLSSAPTSSSIPLGSSMNVNTNAATYIAYLFATLAGISKVGSYTGNGTSINLDMGFSSGCRFFMVKRTDSTGDWYIFDTVRGIVSANDPHLSLNTTAAEVTTDDSVDPYSLGLTVNQVAATNINVTSATYIFLAIA